MLASPCTCLGSPFNLKSTSFLNVYPLVVLIPGATEVSYVAVQIPDPGKVSLKSDKLTDPPLCAASGVSLKSEIIESNLPLYPLTTSL